MQVLEEPIFAIETKRAETNRAETKRLRIVLAGGNGHLGNILARRFYEKGHEVTVLARTTEFAPWRMAAWDGESLREWPAELEGADVLINFAGRSVNCRYDRWNRRAILDSRVKSTRALGEAIEKLANPPRTWLNMSTATIYRHALDRPMDERSGELGGNEKNTPASWRFSIEVAKRWEEAFFAARTPRTRKVALRSAMVMSAEKGGAFNALLRLVRFGLGGVAGSGEQYVSWIHEEDFARAIEFLISHLEMEGPVNVAAPEPLPNREFMAALREAWGAKFGLSAKKWMLEAGAILLQTETELILKSRRVVPGRLMEEGFAFRFPKWGEAAGDLVRRRKRRARD